MYLLTSPPDEREFARSAAFIAEMSPVHTADGKVAQPALRSQRAARRRHRVVEDSDEEALPLQQPAASEGGGAASVEAPPPPPPTPPPPPPPPPPEFDEFDELCVRPSSEDLARIDMACALWYEIVV